MNLRRLALPASVTLAVSLLGAGCNNSAPEAAKQEPMATTTAATSAPMASATATTPSTPPIATAAAADTSSAMGAASGSPGGDPLSGKFSLADATKGLTGSGDLVATIDTTKGKMTCKMYDDKAPITVANFVGLARGVRPWKDPSTGTWGAKPAYDGTSFHRVIAGFMIQGGDPKGTGTGEPGYVIPDEIWAGAKHDKAGQLCMANRGPNTNGAQFFITDAPAANLDGNYTIFGECKPTDVEHSIATVDKDRNDKPLTKVTINKITVARAKY